jgi:hypothetical protein
MSALVNSKMQMLNEDEILGIAAQETGSQYSVEQGKAALLAEVYEGGALLMREGNTFIVVKETNNPDVVVIRPINADVIENFIDNIIKAMQVQVQKGIPYAVVDFTDERILSLLKAIVKKAQGLINVSYSVKQSTTGMYRVIFKLAPAGGLPTQGESA